MISVIVVSVWSSVGFEAILFLNGLQALPQDMLEAGIVCGPAGPNVLRFVPPLIVTRKDVDRVVSALDAVLGEV